MSYDLGTHHEGLKDTKFTTCLSLLVQNLHPRRINKPPDFYINSLYSNGMHFDNSILLRLAVGDSFRFLLLVIEFVLLLLWLY